MTLALTGHAGAEGIAIGRVHLAERSEAEIGEYRIHTDEVHEEIERFQQAIGAASEQLNSLGKQFGPDSGVTASEIISTHVALLRDETFHHSIESRIREELCNAEWALQAQLEQILAEFRQINDPYIRSRGEDVAHVVSLVQHALSEKAASPQLDSIPDRLADTLVVASDLTPGELAALHQRGVAGIITEHGSAYSHTAIMAGSLDIPAVLGVRLARDLLQEGENLVIDGRMGLVYANPNKALLAHYRDAQRRSARKRRALQSVRELPTVTLDGVEVSLQTNAERIDEIQLAIQAGAECVGLYRTEFLFLGSEVPGEEEQFEAYSGALKVLEGRALTIRTLDLGADKTLQKQSPISMPSAPNPALGLRAIRFCLRDTEMFKTQLRAILRTSAIGPVRCLIPMLTSVHEVRMVKSLIEEASQELRDRGLTYDKDMPLGGMIEVPAAALSAADLALHLDFLSVGTNDLLQYTLAADRVDEQVAHLYDPQHPGVLRLLQIVVDAGIQRNIPVAVCGEIGGNVRYIPLLLALGLREFSMHANRLLEVKQVVTRTHVEDARKVLEQWQEGQSEAYDLDVLKMIDASQQKH
ncbi:MAG TPA: phosphoenolpyruvate--protein phosphotransferase [Xanthomonadales bacterium]|nr:phosphoenolpyruvate--protein phosphotransferase [Xanthomonadales bacterium]